MNILMIIFLFYRSWSKELGDSIKQNKKPSFLKALFQMFGSKLIIHGIYLAITDMVFR